MPQEKFHYKTLEDVKLRVSEIHISLPFVKNRGAFISKTA